MSNNNEPRRDSVPRRKWGYGTNGPSQGGYKQRNFYVKQLALLMMLGSLATQKRGSQLINCSSDLVKVRNGLVSAAWPQTIVTSGNPACPADFNRKKLVLTKASFVLARGESVG